MALSPLLAAAEASVLVLPEPERRVLSVTGSEAKTWLNGILTCDVVGTSPTRGVYGLLLTKQGKIQADVDVIDAGERLLLGVRAAPGEDIHAVLDRYLIMEDAELADEPSLGWVRSFGGQASAAAARVTTAVGFGSIDWLGIGGAALALPRAGEDAALASLLATPGAQRLGIDSSEWTLLRIACGVPSFGDDFGPDDNPHQAGLDRRAISWTKGCYLGQEVVCMQDMRGKLKRRLTPLEVDGDDAVPVGAEVRAANGGTLAGQVTTSARGSGNALAFARLSAPFFESAEPLQVAGRSARIVGPRGSGDGSFSG